MKEKGEGPSKKFGNEWFNAWTAFLTVGSSQFHQHFTCAFCTNILEPKITKLCFGFEIFWRQNIIKKETHKMLMKLTPGVDFINILRQYFGAKNFKAVFWV